MFEWQEKYAVDIHEIDRQHRGLVETINRLFSAMQSGAGKDVLDVTLSELVEYTRKHFLTEELLMENYDYPGLAEHQQAHRHFSGEIRKFQQDFQSGNTGISIQLITFLRDWLADHICEMDKNYAVYLRDKGLR